MTRYTAEQVQEIVEDWEDKYNKLEENYSYLLEDCRDTINELREECENLNNRYRRVLNEYAILNAKYRSLFMKYMKYVTHECDIKGRVITDGESIIMHFREERDEE